MPHTVTPPCLPARYAAIADRTASPVCLKTENHSTAQPRSAPRKSRAPTHGPPSCRAPANITGRIHQHCRRVRARLQCAPDEMLGISPVPRRHECNAKQFSVLRIDRRLRKYRRPSILIFVSSIAITFRHRCRGGTERRLRPVVSLSYAHGRLCQRQRSAVRPQPSDTTGRSIAVRSPTIGASSVRLPFPNENVMNLNEF